MEEITFPAMSTQITLAGEGDSQFLKIGFKHVRQFIEDNEIKFSRFQKTSELNRFNRSNGSWFQASPELVFLVMLVNQYVEETSGLFDPSMISYLEQAGYDRTISQLPHDYSSVSNDSIEHVGFTKILVDKQENRIRLANGMRLDLGGIAKGWIAEQAAHILSDYSSACLVSAGGDMFMIGVPEKDGYWPIAIEDPQVAGNILLNLDLPAGAIATSTSTKRTWKKAGILQHHIIDPRTGLPSASDWVSVSVLAEHSDKAEVFAKSLLIAGSRQSPILLEKYPDLLYLAVDQVGRLWGPARFSEYIHES
jgi:thiamine biosynthesis lipoprotein